MPREGHDPIDAELMGLPLEGTPFGPITQDRQLRTRLASRLVTPRQRAKHIRDALLRRQPSEVYEAWRYVQTAIQTGSNGLQLGSGQRRREDAAHPRRGRRRADARRSSG